MKGGLTIDSCRIYIYKSQLNRYKLVKLISKALKFTNFRHNKYWSSINLKEEKCLIKVYDSSILIIPFGGDNIDIAYDIKKVLVDNLNAEKLCFIIGKKEEWSDLKNYKPKIINQIRYKLVDFLNY